MHEMSIANSILEGVLKAAADHPGMRIDEVALDVGAMKLVVPEALDLAWSAVSAGSAAAGSTLKIREVPIEAACRACGRRFDAEVDNFLCPSCGQADVDIVAGDDIILTEIVGQTDKE